MSDQTQGPAAPPRFGLYIDLRDVLGAAGILLALAGAVAFHWGAALFVSGAGLFALASRLSRR